MKVLITGSNGFIGSHLKKLIADSGDVPVELPQAAIPLENADNGEFLSDIDGVIHLAGLVKAPESELAKANTLGTIQLLSLLEKQGKRNIPFVYASSFSVYAPQDGPLNELSATKPASFYGLSKLWAENVVEHFSDKGIINGVSLRLSNVYGPGMRPFSHSVVATFVSQIAKGDAITINGNGSQQRDFIYIDDAILSFTKALKASQNGYSVYTICSGKPISLKDLIAEIELITNKKANASYNSSYTEQGQWFGDSTRAQNILDWKTTVPIEEGLKNLL